MLEIVPKNIDAAWHSAYVVIDSAFTMAEHEPLVTSKYAGFE